MGLARSKVVLLPSLQLWPRRPPGWNSGVSRWWRGRRKRVEKGFRCISGYLFFCDQDLLGAMWDPAWKIVLQKRSLTLKEHVKVEGSPTFDLETRNSIAHQICSEEFLNFSQAAFANPYICLTTGFMVTLHSNPSAFASASAMWLQPLSSTIFVLLCSLQHSATQLQIGFNSQAHSHPPLISHEINM